MGRQAHSTENRRWKHEGLPWSRPSSFQLSWRNPGLISRAQTAPTDRARRRSMWQTAPECAKPRLHQPPAPPKWRRRPI